MSNASCKNQSAEVIYAMALEDVPASTEDEYPFRVCELKEIGGDFDVISYELALTDELIYASNPTNFSVMEGCKILVIKLVYSEEDGGGVAGYEVFDACHQKKLAVVIEPPTSMLEPLGDVNFANTDSLGNPLKKEEADYNLSHWNAASAGLLAILDIKEYHPIRASYYGGEKYFDENGEKAYRERGELRFDEDTGEPLYLKRRELVTGSTCFCLHRSHRLDKNIPAVFGDAEKYYSDDPFFYKYVDGTACNLDMKCVAVQGIYPEEWQTTLKIEEAQYDYDPFVCPNLSQGETIPKGTVVFVTGEEMSEVLVPVRDEEGNVVWEDNKKKQAVTIKTTVNYYEAEPAFDYYFYPLLGQASTYGALYDLEEDVIKEVPKCGNNTRTLVRTAISATTGEPVLIAKHKVCRISGWEPARAVFFIKDNEERRYPISAALNVSAGFGLFTSRRRLLDGKPHEETYYYRIERELVSDLQGKYILYIRPTMPYQKCSQLDDTL